MESFSAELRKAREAKRLTLSDISDATAINVQFLQAIEEGNTSILPAPYIRAFIKEYANVLGLDPIAVLHQYDLGAGKVVPAAVPAEQPPPAEAAETPSEAAPPPEARPLSARFGRYAILLIVIAAFGIGIWNVWRQPDRPKALTTADSLQIAPASAPTDSVKEQAQPVPPKHVSVKDSLTLTGTAKDTVWVLVQIDTLPPRDFLLQAGHKFSWKARERFLLTLGNAGGVDLTLNSKHLGSPGKRGVVVRNMEITRRLLTQP